MRHYVSDAGILKKLPVMKRLLDLDDGSYLELVKSLLLDNYKLVAIFSETDDCLAVMWCNITSRLHTGKTIYIAQLVVDEPHRGKRHAASFIAWIKSQAISLGYQAITLDSGIQRQEAHKFYFSQGFRIASFNFKLTGI